MRRGARRRTHETTGVHIMADDGIRAAIRDSSSDATVADLSSDTPDDARYLFTQTAGGMGVNLDGRITLHGIGSDTRWFSDRPYRMTGTVTTQVFVSEWSRGADNFAENPPNAVVAMNNEDGVDELVVVLEDPRLDGDDLSYAVTVLDGRLLPGEGSVAVFIDGRTTPG